MTDRSQTMLSTIGYSQAVPGITRLCHVVSERKQTVLGINMKCQVALPFNRK